MVVDGKFRDLVGETDKIVLLCDEVAERNGLDLRNGYRDSSMVERTILYTNAAGGECAFVYYREDEPGKSRVIGNEQFLEQVTAAVSP